MSTAPVMPIGTQSVPNNTALASNVTSSRPGTGNWCNVYLARLPIHTFKDEDLERLVNQFGKVISARIMRQKGSGLSKGYAFILYSDTGAAMRCVDALNGKRLDSSHILECRLAHQEASNPDKMTTIAPDEKEPGTLPHGNTMGGSASSWSRAPHGPSTLHGAPTVLLAAPGASMPFMAVPNGAIPVAGMPYGTMPLMQQQFYMAPPPLLNHDHALLNGPAQQQFVQVPAPHAQFQWVAQAPGGQPYVMMAPPQQSYMMPAGYPMSYVPVAAPPHAMLPPVTLPAGAVPASMLATAGAPPPMQAIVMTSGEASPAVGRISGAASVSSKRRDSISSSEDGSKEGFVANGRPQASTPSTETPSPASTQLLAGHGSQPPVVYMIVPEGKQRSTSGPVFSN